MAAQADSTPVDGRSRLDLLRRAVLPALVLVFITLAAYAPVVYAGYVWDDDGYVTGNALLKDAEGLFDMWFRLGSTTMYAPAVFTTFWVEYQLWGLDPLGYHLVNLAFHAACVLLLWRVLRRLDLRGAWLAAALFGIHPVMVESVAWVAELKNVQSAFFCLLSLLAYLRFSPLDGTASPDARTRRLSYTLALLLFALAVLTKAVAVTLPAVLLILVWWKRGRVQRSDLLAVAPMLAMGFAAGLVTIFVERNFSGAIGTGWQSSMLERTLVAGRAVWFYAAKLAWPADLLSIYPRWQVSTNAWWQYLFPAGALAVVGILWSSRERLGRGPLAAVLCFGVLVSPLIGFFNVSYHMYSFVADHFQYHAAPALFALFAWGVESLRSRKGGALGRAVEIGSGVVLLGLAILTTLHVRTFNDEKTRCLSTIAGNPGAWSAMYNLGVKLKAEGNPREALHWYAEALKVTPDNPEVLNNAGVALLSLGDAQEAIRHYREALRHWPTYALAHNNLGTALAGLGDRESAIREYSEALRSKPDYAEAHANLAQVLAAEGRLDDAIREYREALRIRPDDAGTHHSLGIALAGARRFDEASAEFQAALRIHASDATIRRDLATALANQGNLSEAISQYEESLRLAPGDAETHNGLAMARAWAGQPGEAAKEFEAALQLKPDYAEAHNNFGTLLASQGDIEPAIAHYEQAIRLRPDYAEAHANLGTAAASAGRLEAAVAEYREAVRLAPGSAPYRERLGVGLAQAGRLDEAIAEFEHALAINPESAGARKNLEFARSLQGGRPGL
jgi:tetratricopeptide (TPR) repeat protein